jgi:hypothetical protein
MVGSAGRYVTAAELLRIAVRRWPVVLAGALITLLGGYHVLSTRGEYVTAVGIYFLGPQSANNANRYLADDDVISVAELVGVAVNGKTARAEMQAQGLRDHYTLQLFNAGNQFVAIHDRAVLDLSVRGKDETSVRRSLQLVLDRVDRELQRQQQEVGASPKSWVTTSRTPADPPIVHGMGSGLRALAAILALGAALTLTAAVVVDNVLRRRAARVRS